MKQNPLQYVSGQLQELRTRGLAPKLRVLEGEQVPADEKVYSIFEDHTQLIKRGEQRTPVEKLILPFGAADGDGDGVERLLAGVYPNGD